MRRFIAARLRRMAVGMQYRAFAVRLLARNEHPDPYSLGAMRAELAAEGADAVADALEELADVLVGK